MTRKLNMNYFTCSSLPVILPLDKKLVMIYRQAIENTYSIATSHIDLKTNISIL